MLKSLIPYWRNLFSESPLDIFLKEVIDSFDDEKIVDPSVRQLHRFTQLDVLRKKGVIDSEEYMKKVSQISDAAESILYQISADYLPILPVKAVAGHESGPHYTVEYHDIEDWKYIPRKKVKNKVGIRVDGESMNPLYQDGDILICSKTVIEEVSARQSVIVVAKDNSIFLKNIKKHGSNLQLISLNKEFDPFELPLREILEIWLVESKLNT